MGRAKKPRRFGFNTAGFIFNSVSISRGAYATRSPKLALRRAENFRFRPAKMRMGT
jgi:hypothetical protein